MQKFAGFLKFALVVAAAAVAIFFWWQRQPAEPRFSGTVEVDEVHVASRYGGRIIKLPFREGNLLKEGDLIAELDAAELQARRELAAAQLQELEKGPRQNEIDAALKEWESLQAQLVFAVSDSERNRELAKQRAIASSDAERSESNAKALRNRADAAEFRYRLLEEGTRPERLRQARAQLAEIDAQLREMRIVAPGPSVLEVLSVKVGDVVAANREIATLILPDYLWVRVYVPAPWLSRISLGQPVELEIDGAAGLAFRGEVEQINRMAEFTPRNVQTAEDRLRQVFGVKIRLENRDGLLRAGMSGEVRFREKGAL